MLFTLGPLLILVTAAGAALAQQTLRFEAASIHRMDPAVQAPSGCTSSPGLLRCSNVTLHRCIVGAYSMLSDQVKGGPGWIDQDRFGIVARAATPVGDQGLMGMLQTLLQERFQLSIHKEVRPGEAMVLEAGVKGPLKMKPAVDGSARSWSNRHDRLEATAVTMGELAQILGRNLRIPVVDHTRLPGRFDFTLAWDPTEADKFSHAEGAVVLRSEMTGAVARQLGLTLKSRKMPVEVLVVDRAEKLVEE